MRGVAGDSVLPARLITSHSSFVPLCPVARDSDVVVGLAWIAMWTRSHRLPRTWARRQSGKWRRRHRPCSAPFVTESPLDETRTADVDVELLALLWQV